MVETNETPQEPKVAVHKPHYGLWIALFCLIGCVSIYFIWSAARAPKISKAPKTPPAVPIEVGTVRKGRINSYIRALGTVVPLQTVSVVSRIQGQILSVHFQEGQMVKKGDTLITIDPRPFEAALLEAQGQLEKDSSLLKQAQNNLHRYKKAYAEKAIPQQQLSDQEQLVLQTRAAIKTDQGNLANAKVNLEYCNITSPIDGRVGLRLVDAGNLVQANSTQQLAVVTQLEPISVIFSITEDAVFQVLQQLGKNNKMTVDAFDRSQKNKLAEGMFLALDNQIDPATGTVRIRALFENKEHTLFPNQFVNARLLLQTLNDVLLVPTSAIQLGPEGPYVYVIQSNNVAKSQPIKIDLSEGEDSAVQGLSEGQTIATNGFDKLHDGVTVRVRQSEKTRSPITRN